MMMDVSTQWVLLALAMSLTGVLFRLLLIFRVGVVVVLFVV